MDDMQITELYIATKYLDYAEVDAWMQTRELMLSVLGPYLKEKDTKSSDLIRLPIDDEEARNHTTEITDKEIEWFNKYKNNFKPSKKEKAEE